MRLIGILALVVLRPVRLLHGSFALLAVGIAWNALFLQTDCTHRRSFASRRLLPMMTRHSQASLRLRSMLP